MLKRKIFNTATKEYQENPINDNLQQDFRDEVTPEGIEAFLKDKPVDDINQRLSKYVGYDPEFMGRQIMSGGLESFLTSAYT